MEVTTPSPCCPCGLLAVLAAAVFDRSCAFELMLVLRLSGVGRLLADRGWMYIYCAWCVCWSKQMCFLRHSCITVDFLHSWRSSCG
jgi:hypothetical protein